MRTPTRIGVYAAGLLAIFGASVGVGRVVGPDAAPPPPPPHAAMEAAGDAEEAGGHAGAEGEHLPRGLQVAQDGYRLEPTTTRLPVGTPAPFTFRVTGPDGEPVTGYTPTHEKNLHLVAVRRDLTDFQHVHPTMAADGTWSVPLAAGAAGQYRVFADFQPAARAEPLTLGVDVAAAGRYEPRPLPAATRTATVAGYTVTLTGDLVPGTASPLTLSVTRDGRPVTDLQPYLGAFGHLVALRDGDLAYLHVHPEETPGAGPDLRFVAEVPSAGAYRLFLDFQHGGTVRTAAFTAYAGEATPAPAATGGPAAPTSSPSHHDDGHGHD